MHYISDSNRKIVEHICLLKAKVDLSEEEENDMLDYLYTTQYQMGGILAISLGELLLHIDMYPPLLFQFKPLELINIFSKTY